MAIQYIPSTHQQRPRRTGWDMMLPQMAQALFGSMLQEKAWEKRFGTQQEATGKARELARVHEKEMAGWQPQEVTTPGGGLMAPGVRTLQAPEPQLVTLGGEKFLKMGPKFTHIKKDKLTDFEKKYGMYKTGEITKEQFLGIKPHAPSASIKNYEFYVGQERKAGRKPMAFNPWLKSVKKAGAPSMTQIMGQEKFGIQKTVTAGNIRTQLLENKDDKNVFEAQHGTFNITSKSEIAYWDTKDKGWFHKEGRAKILKLSARTMKQKWTPKRIQEEAELAGMTIEQFLVQKLKIVLPR